MMSAEEEEAIKGQNSMKAIRKVMNDGEHDGLAAALELSTAKCTALLTDLYRKATFAGKHLQVHMPAADDELDLGGSPHPTQLVETTALASSSSTPPPRGPRYLDTEERARRDGRRSRRT